MSDKRSVDHPVSAQTISAALNRLNIRPSKGRGQNFLVSQSVVKRTVDALNPAPTDFVVEVGPGLGILTSELAKRAGQVVAIEIDERLALHLSFEYAGSMVTLLPADALTVESDAFLPERGDYLFAGNLPYSVGSAIVRRFLELPRPPRRMVFMIQKEVAERMAASPPKMSVLGISVQLYSHAVIAFDVPPSAFKPRPNVDSSVVVLNRRHVELLPQQEREDFFRVVHAGFHQKRKQLVNTLSTGLDLPKSAVAGWLQDAGVSPAQRAESIDLVTWIALYKSRPLP